MFTRTFVNRLGGYTTRIAKTYAELQDITRSMNRMGWLSAPATEQVEIGHAAFGSCWSALSTDLRPA